MTRTSAPATARGSYDAIRFDVVGQHDPLAVPLLDELAVEYSSRYGGSAAAEAAELRAYPAEEFEPPGGVLIVAILDGRPVAGGAFRRYDDTTAELKRIWTSAAHRQRGYGKVVVAQLERLAWKAGYRRIYLTTGWRQPEAVALYLASGYTPLFDQTQPSSEIGPHPFQKQLRAETHGRHE